MSCVSKSLFANKNYGGKSVAIEEYFNKLKNYTIISHLAHFTSMIFFKSALNFA